MTQLRLDNGRAVRTRLAGLFLFLPLLARLQFQRLVAQADYPGSKMIPAFSAVLSLLALKLLDKERRSHIDDFNTDEALGWFAGLNIMPKKSYATAYAYRTQRHHQERLLKKWIQGLAPLLFPQADTFSLDFHAIPFRGDPSGLDNHFVPKRGLAVPSILTFFAQEHASRVLCYANATLLRTDQTQEPLRFVDFWRELTGVNPAWLYFDSKLVPYAQLEELRQRGINFVTIRRRGLRQLRRLETVPAESWQQGQIDIPKRKHKKVWYLDERVRLRGYTGEIRQLAVKGLGREKPTLFLSNETEETGRELIQRYALRNRIEDGIGTSVNFFHLDCLASEVSLNVDIDVALTVLANGCYRWLGTKLRGHDRTAPKKLFRRCVETAGLVEVQSDRLVIHFDKRSHVPLIREAGLDRDCPPIPWLHNKVVQFSFS